MTEPPIDYRELLLLYIQHVICCEGIDFIDRGGYTGDVELTKEQEDILRGLKDEGDARMDRGELPIKRKS